MLIGKIFATVCSLNTLLISLNATVCGADVLTIMGGVIIRKELVIEARVVFSTKGT